MTGEPADIAEPEAAAVESTPDRSPAPGRSPSTAGERLSRWVAVAANIGALIGLLLVAIQLRETRALMGAQIRHDLSSGIVELLNTPAANGQLASVLRRGSLGEPLSPDELFQFRLRSNALLRYWEDVHYQYRQGLYDAVEFASQKKAWADSLARSVGLTSYWCEVRNLYSPDFASELDGLLKDGSCKAA